MTRKHFEALAYGLRRQRPERDEYSPEAYTERLLEWQRCVKAMADVCRQFNGLFDRERFIDACGAR